MKLLKLRETETGEGRAPHGARGLKLVIGETRIDVAGRAPHGARGLKRRIAAANFCCMSSRPTRGAWIETFSILSPPLKKKVAPHTGRVD